MDLKLLAKSDLNLLVTLQVLLEERNVSRAADRLFLTQSAISKSLARLRDKFEDPLFTRASKGLVPTPLAVSLAEPLGEILNQTSALFVREEFNAAIYQGEINIAVVESLEVIFLPVLLEKLSRTAPGMVINTRSHFENQLEGLERGELDFVLSPQFVELSGAYYSDFLLADSPIVLAGKHHPLVNKKVLMGELISYPRIALMLADMEKFAIFQSDDHTLDFMENWPIAYRTENLAAALNTLTKTDYLLPGPSILNYLSSQLNFTFLDMANTPEIQVDFYLVYHKRIRNSAAHQWLRGVMIELFANFREKKLPG